MDFKHMIDRFAGKHLTSCSGNPCECGAKIPTGDAATIMRTALEQIVKGYGIEQSQIAIAAIKAADRAMTEARESALIVAFPPTPRPAFTHPTLGELFDNLQLQFFAAKHAENMAQLLDAAYIVHLKPRAAPAYGPTTGGDHGK